MLSSPLQPSSVIFGSLWQWIWSPPLGRFVAQQCREPLKGDLANAEGAVQGNHHIFDNFLATSLHFCRAASAALRGLGAALGHQRGHSDPSPALGMLGASWGMEGSWLLESPEH